MPLNTISTKRPLTSYAKIRSLIGNLIRNRSFQLRSDKITKARYLDLGCGDTTHPGFIHLDYFWLPGVDLCWDIQKGLPFPDASLDGVFTQHMLEHFDLPKVKFILNEIHRVLVPGGTLRIVVPDAELYLRTYLAQLGGENSTPFPYQDSIHFEGIRNPMLSVNRVFYQDRESLFGHCIMYDFSLLKDLLEKYGFHSVAKSSFGQSRSPALAVDCPQRQVESLYVEAVA